MCASQDARPCMPPTGAGPAPAHSSASVSGQGDLVPSSLCLAPGPGLHPPRPPSWGHVRGALDLNTLGGDFPQDGQLVTPLLEKKE